MTEKIVIDKDELESTIHEVVWEKMRKLDLQASDKVIDIFADSATKEILERL